MPRYDTGNQVPSSDMRDVWDNNMVQDALINGDVHSVENRKGKRLTSWAGIENMTVNAAAGFGYITLNGLSFSTGATVKLNEILLNTDNNCYYKWTGFFPEGGMVVPEDSTLDSAGGEGPGKWMSVGDASLKWQLKKSGNASLVFVVENFHMLKLISGVESVHIKTEGHHITGVGSATYSRDYTYGEPSTGDERKFFDADGDGWILDRSQRIDAKMFGMVGYGDNVTDETAAFVKALSFSSDTGIKVDISRGEYGYYLLGQVYIPDNTNLEFSSDSVIKARDDLKQEHNTTESFEVLFRFQDTKGATWKCNGARFFYDKTKYSGEHNHVFMFDGASDIFIHDPNAQMAGGDGYYVGGRFSVSKHCENIHLFRPKAFKPRRNCLSLISCNGLYVHDHDFQSAGIDGNNSSGPCAGIDVEPETYTDALMARFYNGQTRNNLRQGTVFAMTKLPAGVVVDIQMDSPKSYSDSRGFECTRVNARNRGLIRLINPIAEKCRYSSFHSINSSSAGILYELLRPLAIDPSTSTDNQHGGGAPYYFNNYNDGSVEDVYPQKFGGIRLVSAAVKFVTSDVRPDYCVRVKLNAANINAVTDIQADNIEIIDPLFRKTDFVVDCLNFTAPSALTYNPLLDVRFAALSDYRKDNIGNGFNARSYPGGYFTNLGTTQNIVINLNEAVVGRQFEVVVLSPFTITINPSGANIFPLITSNAGSQRIASSTIGSRVRLKCEEVNGIPAWIIYEMGGTWSVS